MCNSEIRSLLGIIISILEIFRFLVPIILIILCAVDVFKLIISKKEDEVKKLRQQIFRKILYGVLFYLVPFIVPLVLSLCNKILPMDYSTNWKTCWDIVKEVKKSEESVKNT